MKLRKINRALGLVLALWCCLAAPALAALAAPAVPAPAQPRWAVYFSPQGGCTEAIVTAVGQARRFLHIEAYIFTSNPILKAVIAAQTRGVKVAVIMDPGEIKEKFSVFSSLLPA